MSIISWQKLPLVDRIRRLKYFLPPVIAIVVVLYQLFVARALHDYYGHLAHFLIEIAFYSVAGPLVTWVTLGWIENGLSERVALERQVRAQTQQLASLASASADAIVSLDHQSNISSWNQGAQRMFEYNENEIIGHPLTKLLPDTSSIEERIQTVGVVQNFETIALASDGRQVTVDLTQTRMDDEADEVPVSLLIMRDITTRRERETILEEERARISRDLHDGVAQTLYFLALKADMAHEMISQNSEGVADELEEIGRESRRVIRDVRRTIFALQPLDWSQDEFLPALRGFVERFAEQVGWQFEIDIEEGLSFAPRMEPTIFRIIQESLNNVAKHSTANKITIKLQGDVDPTKLSLIVQDNGQGIDLGKNGNEGFGLDQMRQRVESIGGVFNIEGFAGQGTLVHVRLPFQGGSHEGD